STTCCARKRTRAWAVVRRAEVGAVTAALASGDGFVHDAPHALLVPERDRSPLAERLLAGAGQDECRQAVLAGHGGPPLLANRRSEFLELEEVRLAEAFGEVGDPVDRGVAGGQPDVVSAPVISNSDRRPRADDLRRALVAVAGDPRLVD